MKTTDSDCDIAPNPNRHPISTFHFDLFTALDHFNSDPTLYTFPDQFHCLEKNTADRREH